MSTEPLRVLVVDDDYRVAALHISFVNRVPGFRTIGQAHTAAEALELNAVLHPDLVLLDVYLPDEDGLSVARQLLSATHRPAVIVISAANDQTTIRQAVQLGAFHYLVKPFGFAVLAERLTAFHRAHTTMTALPDDADQDEINQLFALLHPSLAATKPPRRRFAPTTQLVFNIVSTRGPGLSAAEVAHIAGISRATAQRSLTQLEHSDVVELELRYGSAGRPEHRYSVKEI